jgi:dicarboxylate transporter 10
MMAATGSEIGQNAFQMTWSMYRTEGILSFFKGWTPSFMRTGPQTVLTFVFLEQFKKWYRSLHSNKMIY